MHSGGPRDRTGFRRLEASVILAVTAAFLFPGTSPAQAPEEPLVDEAAQIAPPVMPPAGLETVDTPNDRGGSVNVSWDISPDDVDGAVSAYVIYRSAHPETGFVRIGQTDAGATGYRDGAVQNGAEVYYRVAAAGQAGESLSGAAGPVVASPQWFDSDRWNVLITVVVFVWAIVYFVRSARAGKELFIRRLAGLDEIDNAVGRATEMGKPILYISGLSSISDVATIAAVNILGEVAKKAAECNTRLIVPCADPIVMAVEQEVVKEAYASVGRPDAYREDDVFYLTRSQFAYVAGVSGIMVRQRPATILHMGMFYAESLVLAETGAAVGSIQIAGTDAVTQLPFFITSCDYTLIGEELYAASAYLSREPVLLGGLKGQDAFKFIVGVLFVVAVVVATLAATGVIGSNFMSPVFATH